MRELPDSSTLFPLRSSRHRQSNDDYLEGKRENYHVCCVQFVCNSCAQCSAHTHMNRPNSCLLVRFSFYVVIFCVSLSMLDLVFLGLFCVIVYLCMCAFVTLDLVSSVLC